MSSGKVLIILSDAHGFPITKKDGSVTEEESGVFLMELAKPLTTLLDAGYSVTFASPKGKGPNIDPLSTSIMAFLGNYWERAREQDLIKKMELENNFKSPTPFASIADEELETFDGVFIPGGHAPLSDLGDDPDLGRILLYFHKKQKPTAAICHGPYAFLSTIHAPGSEGFAYEGYKITSWSDAEEGMIEMLKGGEIPKAEGALRQAGVDFVSTAGHKVAGYITVDREVVSGANPTAAQALGDKFLEMLKA